MLTFEQSQNLEPSPVVPDHLFAIRVLGIVLVGMALMVVPRISLAATMHEGVDVPTSQKACLRSMNALIRDSKGAATRVEVSAPSATTAMARIFVSDGEVRVICDESAREMKISRILDVVDDDTATSVGAAIRKNSL